MTEQSPIVIVGTGLAGYSLAREIRKQDKGARIVMVTADDGVSYSKPMLSTGFTKGKDAEGLAQADTEAMAKQLNLELRTYTTVTGIDTEGHRLLLGDESLSYSKLVLAWGADVIRLTIPGSGLERVFPINDLEDYRVFRKALKPRSRVAIMGAGLIGCEFANDLRNGDYDVEVIAPSDAVMPSLLPPVAASAVQAELESLGVRFHLQTVVEKVEPADKGVTLFLANGKTLQADLVISAVGLRPRTQLARTAGIDTDRGITVNRALETSADDVYALGDCAEVDGHVLLYVLPLMACARALAKTLTGDRTEVSYGTMPVMIKTPCCPAAVCPPPADSEGEWEAEQDGTHVKALFKNAEGDVLGFAVTGRFALEKQALSKVVPPIHS
ncbi:NAD(P)/FAD-dependent oxidoreductase [Marinobacter sp. 2_MG-2023]|uniref:NAD(P)/FAD-dependent oxidoreductase n=1 Tax=Marinobacter sp. 2_MG-2023 TaxID=3062679 RepID=UPI0026E1CDC3|nr:FAD-dependent oxidoreductase [Marinobacter sp. 2_MG-2023]MDO6441471.1 FAD-dependent oxidoreductase [Marinobacter sp. 2_MG-2023]